MAVSEIQEIQTEESRKINEAFDHLLSFMRPRMKPEDEYPIEKAFQLALDAHGSQRRKSGEPYILHPIEVAQICAEEIG